MTGTAEAKKGGNTFSQLRIPYSEVGHQFMYWVNIEEIHIHTARVNG
jgi:hypothetical protein